MKTLTMMKIMKTPTMMKIDEERSDEDYEDTNNDEDDASDEDYKEASKVIIIPDNDEEDPEVIVIPDNDEEDPEIIVIPDSDEDDEEGPLALQFWVMTAEKEFVELGTITCKTSIYCPHCEMVNNQEYIPSASVRISKDGQPFILCPRCDKENIDGSGEDTDNDEDDASDEDMVPAPSNKRKRDEDEEVTKPLGSSEPLPKRPKAPTIKLTRCLTSLPEDWTRELETTNEPTEVTRSLEY